MDLQAEGTTDETSDDSDFSLTSFFNLVFESNIESTEEAKEISNCPGTSYSKGETPRDNVDNNASTSKKTIKEKQITKVQSARLPYIKANLLRDHRECFTRKEVSEIEEVSSVYYFGLGVKKEETFDTLDGYYIAIPEDHIAFRYQIISDISHGKYASVIKVLDCKTEKLMAMKIFRSGREFERNASDEFTMLTYFQQFDSKETKSLVQFYDSFYYRFHSIITFELLSEDLSVFIKKRKQGLGRYIMKTIVKSVLQGLVFLHKHAVIHADLKPDNITLIPGGKYECKIIDFGLSIFMEDKAFRSLIQTPTYRAPEVFLEAPIDFKVDIFSFGLIVAELATGQAVFRGNNELIQMYNYVELFGFPPMDLVCESYMRCKFFVVNPAGVFLHDVPESDNCKPNSKLLEDTLVIYDDPKLVDMIRICLDMDPENRPHAFQLLHNPWLKSKNPLTAKLII